MAAHQALAAVEQQLIEHQERTAVELRQLVAERDAIGAHLAAAQAAATTSGEVARARCDELEILRDTATWRLHERLLPLLRLLRGARTRGG